MSPRCHVVDDAFDGLPFRISGPRFSLHADGRELRPETMSPAGAGVWREDGIEVRLLIGAAADGSHEIVLEADGVRHVAEVCLFDGEVEPGGASVHNHAWFDFWGMQRSTALFLRGATEGIFACYTNPFGIAEIDGDHIRLSYRPGLDVDGHFRSDALVVGGTSLSGRLVRREVIRGRDIAAGQVAGYIDLLGPEGSRALDAGEISAVRAAVAARVPWVPARARTAHWDWGENLARLDLEDPETRAVYERLSRLCAELSVETLLVAPGAPTAIEAGSGATTHGGGPWQDIMWLGSGVDVGHGRWRAGEDDTRAAPLLSAAREHGVTPVAYVNPQYLWLREARWRVVTEREPQDPDAYAFSCLGAAEARRWLTETALRFAEANDLGGFSFDFVYWAPCHATDHGHAPGEDSRYAQWHGYRTLVAELRAALPDGWLEGLIGTMQLMPWGAADLTHPHPSMGDNQPQWLPAWPDLSLDRAAGNYQRRTAYWYRNFAFTPSYKVPGQVGHQANRLHFSTPERGWDWEGARYGLLSALASGPSSLSLCFLPCWDETEWQGVRDRDAAFFRRWLTFAREHEQVLSRLEDLFDEPRPGRIDGSIARGEDGTGFVFLTNPDYGPRTVSVPLDDGFVLRELHPHEGRLWLAEVLVEPHTVGIYELVPERRIELPALFGAAGRVLVADPEVPRLTGPLSGRVLVQDVEGVPGTTAVAAAKLPTGKLHQVILRFPSDGITPTLGPWRDQHGSEVDLARFAGGRITTSWVPGTALPDLLAALAPPVSPEGGAGRNPWSDPSRLRLFPALLDPKAARVRLWVDGDPVELHPAYVGTYPDVTDASTGDNNLLGHYADLMERLLATEDLEEAWAVELEVELAWRGQLTGVHVAHLPRRTTAQFEVLA